MVLRALQLMLEAGAGRIVAVSGADTGTFITGHGILATPEHVAEAVALLCTDAVALVNGNTVVADGASVFAFCGRYTKVAE